MRDDSNLLSERVKLLLPFYKLIVVTDCADRKSARPEAMELRSKHIGLHRTGENDCSDISAKSNQGILLFDSTLARSPVKASSMLDLKFGVHVQY